MSGKVGILGGRYTLATELEPTEITQPARSFFWGELGALKTNSQSRETFFNSPVVFLFKSLDPPTPYSVLLYFFLCFTPSLYICVHRGSHILFFLTFSTIFLHLSCHSLFLNFMPINLFL